MDYLPLNVAVNCSSPADLAADPARGNYACSPAVRLESTIIHLLYITAITMLSAMVYGFYRIIQNRKAKKSLMNCAVAATAAAGSSERAAASLASAGSVAAPMLAAAKACGKAQ